MPAQRTARSRPSAISAEDSNIVANDSQVGRANDSQMLAAVSTSARDDATEPVLIRVRMATGDIPLLLAKPSTRAAFIAQSRLRLNAAADEIVMACFEYYGAVVEIADESAWKAVKSNDLVWLQRRTPPASCSTRPDTSPVLTLEAQNGVSIILKVVSPYSQNPARYKLHLTSSFTKSYTAVARQWSIPFGSFPLKFGDVVLSRTGTPCDHELHDDDIIRLIEL